MSRAQSPFTFYVAGDTHIGGGTANEDHFRYNADLGLLAVADGVSNRRAPTIAAETAVAALFDHLTDPTITPVAQARERMERTLAVVHRRVREQAAADEQLRGMATSFACAMESGRLLIVGHAGDSRVIRIRQGQVERLTSDHRRGTDPLVLRHTTDAGSDSKALTRAIGLADSLASDVCVEALHGDDHVLVATAGLTAALDEQTILRVVLRAQHPRRIVRELVQCALGRGAPDNITVVCGYWRQIGV